MATFSRFGLVVPCLVTALLAPPASAAETLQPTPLEGVHQRALAPTAPPLENVRGWSLLPEVVRGHLQASLNAPQNEGLLRDLLQNADAALARKPDPVVTIVSEGKLKSDPKKVRTAASLRDMKCLQDLMFAYVATGRAQYADKAVEFVLAWAGTNISQGNPINDTKLDSWFWSYSLLEGRMQAAERAVVRKYLGHMVASHRTTWKSGRIRQNWRSHQLKILGLSALTLKDWNLWQEVEQGVKTHLGQNLLADGSSQDFRHRDALHYHIYTLLPLLTLGQVARANQLPLGYTDFYRFQSSGRSSIQQSIAFLIPYFTGEKTHAEYVNSRIPFDRARSEAGETGHTIGELFQPEKARRVLELAATFDPEIATTLKKKPAEPSAVTLLDLAYATAGQEKKAATP